jgi:hypothetical protein
MAFSSGTYTLPGPALSTGDTVSATENNTLRNDMASSFNLTWLRNGTAAATADIPMGGYKITGLAAATSTGDALAYGRAATVTDLTTTGNTILGDASTDTLNVGNGGLIKDASGNVGVGVTPSAWSTSFRGLQFGGAGCAWSSVSGFAGTYIGNNYYYSASGRTYQNTNTAVEIALASGGIQFSIAPSGTAGTAVSFTQAMTLDTSGNLLVGTTDVSATTGNGIKIIKDRASTSGYNAVSVVSNASSSAYSTYELYTASGGAGYKFYVAYNGTISAVTTTITAISDQRLKENIRDLDDGLEKLMALKPRKFDWKEGKGANTKDARGFIAQEFEEVFPDMIQEWKDPAPEGEEPYKAVNANLIPTLVKAIQEMKSIIDNQAVRIAALEAK